MSVISASCGGNYAPLFWIFNPFFNVFTSVFHHLRHVFILFTKLSTDTMLSSVLESGFIFSWAFPLRRREEVIACFCAKERRHMMCLLTFILTHIPKHLASFHLRATPSNLSRSDRVCWEFRRHVLSRTRNTGWPRGDHRYQPDSSVCILRKNGHDLNFYDSFVYIFQPLRIFFLTSFYIEREFIIQYLHPSTP